MRLHIAALLLISAGWTQAVAQGPAAPERRHSLGSSVFLLGNAVPGDPPHFYLLNYRYEPTRTDAVFMEAISWTYYEPLGTYGSSDEKYPGKIRAIGLGVGYQRFVWRRLFVTGQVTPFRQQFIDPGNAEIQRGFQLYLQSRTGYRFELLKRRWFLEPSVAFNWWPVNTNFPAGFAQVERDKPNYFLFEPGLHFGFRF